jgi:hypothetical protein
MKVHSIKLISKNNKQRGTYIYFITVENDGKYFYCKSITTKNPISKNDININDLEVTREIPKEFYKANNIFAE